MAHLTCTEHSKRVLVIVGKTIHRHDGSSCISNFLRIGNQTISPLEVPTNKRVKRVNA